MALIDLRDSRRKRACIDYELHSGSRGINGRIRDRLA
jgi:hypothetical protein